ncbi:MAG: bifunctional riboflavin kinase/FAD synthetase [Deltaproteobacteria bacterium]|nr:bifunctional riboflavin kinase/FAD synthetase [Deltaproteobacteria bacterium]
MKVLEINEIDFKNSVITIGSFDGIHLGHRKLMELAKSLALKLNLPSVVLTFHPHPLKVLHPEEKIHLITTFQKKIELIRAIGIDYLIYITFTPRFASMTPEDFIENVIVKKLNPVKIIVGHDFGFGIGKSGNIALLGKLANKLNFDLVVVGPVKMSNKIVSSTLIRRLVLSGRVCAVKRFLGRHYSVHGKVVKGSGRGKKLGFPTSNIIPEEELFPKDGVYATLVKIDNEFHDSVTNVGSNPTFNEEIRRIETYIFNFDKDLYGKEIEVFFVARLRPEIKFDNAAQLESRIRKDITLTTAILSKEHMAPI